jgi:aspartate aminotransferase-like enzyme
MDLQDNVFMLPGPVKLHPRVLNAMAHPVIAHRGPEVTEINIQIRELLKYLFQSQNDVAVISGSGTAGVESCMASLLRKGDKVLNITNGKFGERLNELSQVFAEPVLLEYEWGKAPDLEQLAATLEEQPDIKAITLCHNETSTALTNPAEEIGKLARKHDCLYILDGITSVGGIQVLPDQWGADFTILGSQKCIAAPAGLAAISVSERAMEAMHGDSTYYLNLKKHVKKLKVGGQTPYTPAIPLFMALRESLLMIKEEGLENRFTRIKRLATATRSAVNALDLSIFPDPAYASDTVTAINYPELPGVDNIDKIFRGTLKDKHGVIVAGAQEHIKGKVFRIGHMGICSFTDLAATFAAVEAQLKAMGHKFEEGAGVAAVAEMM